MSVELDLALAAAVRAGRGGGLNLDAVWQVAMEADANLAGAPDARERIGNALARLEAKGLVLLPSRQSRRAWEHGQPPLPLRVRRVANRTSRSSRPGRGDVTAYREELAGAGSIALRPDEIQVLNAVNVWLGERAPNTPVLPTRERSLEIFGDEKRLDLLVGTRLFLLGVLSLDLLRAFATAPPFHATVVGPADVLLIVENHHTYHSLVRAAREADRGIGMIGYGMGGAITASITYAAELPEHHDRNDFELILYWGDLDAKGLSIAHTAHERARAVGLAAVEPAKILYRSHYVHARWRPNPRGGTPTSDEVMWLDPPVEIVTQLENQLQAVQEAVNFTILSDIGCWV